MAECERRGIPVHVAGVFGSGLLADANSTYAYGPPSEAVSGRAEQWRALASAHGVSVVAVALAFAVLPACVSHVVLGMASAVEVSANVAALAENVPIELFREAQRRGLLAAQLQLPESGSM